MSGRFKVISIAYHTRTSVQSKQSHQPVKLYCTFTLNCISISALVWYTNFGSCRTIETCVDDMNFPLSSIPRRRRSADARTIDDGIEYESCKKD
jgi:hypothetical protein